MIRLDTTTRKLQALLGGSITTNQLPITVCYSDKTSTAYTGGTTVINTNNTTAVDICAAPAASTVRDIDTINVNNADTVAATITIRYNDNGTTYTLFKATLATGDQLTYVHGVGWNVIDSTGKTKVGAGVNGPSSSTDNALVRWDGTAGTAIQNSGWTLSDTDALNGVSGSVGAPSITLNGETTSGIYRIGTNNHGWAISGAKVLDISSTGLAVTGTQDTTGRIVSAAGGIFARGLISAPAAGHGVEIGALTGPNRGFFQVYDRTGAAYIDLEIHSLGLTWKTSGGTSVLAATSTGLAVTGTLSATSTFNVTGTGPHAIGGATNTDVGLYHLGTFAPSGSNGYSALFAQTLTAAANSSQRTLSVGGTINKAGSGTHADFIGLEIVPPTIGAGASTLTNASTLKITGAPTGAINNYAFWVDAGTIRFDGTTGAGANTGTLTNAPSTGNPAYWMPVNANGTTYYIPCWT